MSKSKVSEFAIIFIVISMLYMGFTYAFLDRNSNSSYDGYLSGKYYFRAHALTNKSEEVQLDAPFDPTDQKDMLMYSTGVNIYVYDLHGRYCTVYYDGQIIHDYPVSNLKFDSDEEKDIFYGNKVYTLEEYEARLEGLEEDSPVLSSPDMKNGKSHSSRQEILILTAFFISAVLGFFYFLGDKVFKRPILVIWTVSVAVCDVISFFFLF